MNAFNLPEGSLFGGDRYRVRAEDRARPRTASTQRWEAFHEPFRIPLAIRANASTPTTRDRSWRELRANDHPGVLSVVDVIEIAPGRTGLVVEAPPPGSLSLRARLHVDGVLALPLALRVVMEVATVLEAMHASSRVHGALCPEAIFLLEGPTGLSSDVRCLLDAPAVGESRDEASTHGRPDVAADVYALAAVFFEMVEGGPPSSGKEPLDDARRRVPRALHRCLDSVLSRSPSAPGQGALELAQALAAAANLDQASPVSARPRRTSWRSPPPGAAPSVVDATSTWCATLVSELDAARFEDLLVDLDAGLVRLAEQGETHEICLVAEAIEMAASDRSAFAQSRRAVAYRALARLRAPALLDALARLALGSDETAGGAQVLLLAARADGARALRRARVARRIGAEARGRFVAALAAFGHEALPSLSIFLSEAAEAAVVAGDSEVAEIVVDALAVARRLAPASLKPLARRFARIADPAVGRAATLAFLGAGLLASDDVAWLEEALAHADEQVRWTALEELLRLGHLGPGALSRLRGWLLGEDGLQVSPRFQLALVARLAGVAPALAGAIDGLLVEAVRTTADPGLCAALVEGVATLRARHRDISSGSVS